MTLGKSYIIMGIYYGFPIILSMGPSHLRLLQTRGLAQEKKESRRRKLQDLVLFLAAHNICIGL
ncbi:hypothetical protein LINPERHAP1_LOCUS45230 [Linum perenne]